MNPLELRKQRLIAGSELNRAQLAGAERVLLPALDLVANDLGASFLVRIRARIGSSASTSKIGLPIALVRMMFIGQVGEPPHSARSVFRFYSHVVKSR